jgi:DNA processing protein
VASRHWLQLSFAQGLGPVLIRRLVERTGSAEAACCASQRQLADVPRIGPAKAATLSTSIRAARDRVTAELDRVGEIGAELLTPDDEAYPLLLRDLPDAPVVLWCLGRLEARDLNAMSIVGTRRPSQYGQEQARRFAAAMAVRGVTIVSGGAYGVDTHAHRGALSCRDGRTIAVLGCGVDVPYPPENELLLSELAEGRGAILSELPMGTPPRADHFPRRNRIISGVSRGVLVIEAAERSGALITARNAADDHGRPVFAVPGRIDNPMSAGPHGLIRDGATLTLSPDDVLDNLGPLPAEAYEPAPSDAPLFDSTSTPKSTGLPPVNEAERSVLAALDAGDSIGADALCDRTDLPASTVRTALTMLTIKGLVVRTGGDRYARK